MLDKSATATVFFELTELFDPRLKQLLESGNQDFLDIFVETSYPEGQVGQIFEVKVANDLLDDAESSLKLVLLEWALLHLFQKLFDQICLLHHAVDFFLKGDYFDEHLLSVALQRLL